MISTLIMASTSQYFTEVDGEMLVNKGSVFVTIVDGLGIGSIASTGIGLGLTIGQKIHKWRKSASVTHENQQTKIYSGKHATMSIILHILLSGAIITSAAMVLCGVFPMPEVIPMDISASFHTLFSTFLVPSIIGGAGLLGMVAFGFYDFYGIGSSVQYRQVQDLDLESLRSESITSADRLSVQSNSTAVSQPLSSADRIKEQYEETIKADARDIFINSVKKSGTGRVGTYKDIVTRHKQQQEEARQQAIKNFEQKQSVATSKDVLRRRRLAGRLQKLMRIL
jgi:hypothetical protein